MNARFQTGEILGQPFMKFTLTYRGELRSNDDYRRKWEIRRYFHPQLEELWQINPSLQAIKRHRYVPVSQGWMRFETHHSVDSTLPPVKEPEVGHVEGVEKIDLCGSVLVGGRQFQPLVRDSCALQCGLKITFLRKEEPGRLYQGGDLDNRLKTLLDGLSVPNKDQIVDDDTLADPICCLLEDDRLITSLTIDTHRLLGMPNASKHEVDLLIEVDVRVAQSRVYNQPFLGG